MNRYGCIDRNKILNVKLYTCYFLSARQEIHLFWRVFTVEVDMLNYTKFVSAAEIKHKQNSLYCLYLK